ncbi:RHS repeat-associated core domain-containing protein [Streptomyces sp. NPDC013433]|uniref:RHS repeat-associated core domain-containing protein n=1 Tax=Streptomyces sp. NPDC013433 TaxID=3155604 RepID=UPI003452E1D6
MGNTTVYTFDSWGLPESTIEPATTAHPNAVDRTWTTVYDKAGQAVTELLPGGVERERTYDGLGRLTHETGTGAEAATTDRTLGYDLAGRLTSVGSSEPLNPNTYTYNDRGQLLTTDGPGGAVSYTYDADGNMTERSDAKNATSYGYDSAGRLEWLWNQMTGADIWYEWDAVGRPVMEQYAIQPEGSTEWVESARRSYGYDSLGRLTDDIITTPDESTGIATTTYAYDLDDRLTWKGTAGTAGAGEHVYGYDQAGRLSYWTGGDRTTHYEWDAAGNRVKAGSATATYDERNRLLDDGTSTYRHTPRGTLSTVETGTGSRTLTFDAFERKVTDGTSTYTYDSLDRVAGNGSTAFRSDGDSNNLLGDGTTDYSRTPGGSLLASTDGTTTQWSVTDQHTDLVAGLSVDGTEVTGSTAYDPFGTKTATEGSMPAVGYQSGWTDPDSGDVNMAARWYQPGTGSFASRDTWLLDPVPSGQANRYVYGNADPVNATDPSGHFVPCATPVAAPVCVGAGAGASFGPAGVAAGAAGGLGFVIGYFGYEWWSSSSTSSHFSYVGPGPLSSLDYGGGLADALANQAGLFDGPSAGWSGLVDTGYDYKPGPRTSTPTAPGGCRYSCVIKPPKPPVDQNPNNGPHPVPAPARPKVKPKWADETWTGVQEVSVTVTAQAMVNLAAAAIFTPTIYEGKALYPLPDAKDKPGGGNRWRKRKDKKCDDGPGKSATGHVTYMPRERYYDTFSNREECRATGVFGIVDQQDLTTKAHPGPGTSTGTSKRPPGYEELRSQGGDPENGHLQPKLAGGDGRDLRNLVPQHARTNSPYIRDGVEKDIRTSLEAGRKVALYINPYYGNANSGIPARIEYNYADLGTGVTKH